MSEPASHSGSIDAPEPFRRSIVRLVMAIYLLLIFEGVLRKWLVPEFSRVLFFVRDPLVAVVYVLALHHGFWGEATAYLRAGLALAVAAIAFVIFQSFDASLPAGENWFLAIYGWRNYFFYIPLAFVIAATFRADDIARLMRWTLIIAVPVSLLTVAQYYSPIDSPLNVGSAEDARFQFHGLGADESHTRPMGTFTSALGHKQFVVSAVAAAVALWLGGIGGRGPGLLFKVTTTLAVLVCLAVSGSRGMVLHAGLVVLATTLLAVISRDRRTNRRAMWLPITLAVTAMVLGPLLFQDAIQTFITRWNGAYAVESTNFTWGVFGRALYGFVDFFRLLGDTPLAGYGLGLGGNASTTLGATVAGRIPTSLAEADWSRQIVDIGPVLGILFIVYRISLTAWVGIRALAAARSGGNPVAWLLFGFVGIDLLYGQITGHGSVNGYAWVFTGLCLAAARREAASPLPESSMSIEPAGAFPNLMR